MWQNKLSCRWLVVSRGGDWKEDSLHHNKFNSFIVNSGCDTLSLVIVLNTFKKISRFILLARNQATKEGINTAKYTHTIQTLYVRDEEMLTWLK